MTPLEHLRLAAAVCHTIPASELHLRSSTGETIMVSAHRAADLDACALRNVVRAFACPNNPDYSERIVAIDYGGSVSDLGGGVFRVAHNGSEQRWIASLLQPERIAELLDDIGADELPDEAMNGCLKPDPDLGVTLLVITANHERHLAALDDIAAQAAAAIFVEELRYSASNEAARASHAPRNSSMTTPQPSPMTSTSARTPPTSTRSDRSS